MQSGAVVSLREIIQFHMYIILYFIELHCYIKLQDASHNGNKCSNNLQRFEIFFIIKITTDLKIRIN